MITRIGRAISRLLGHSLVWIPCLLLVFGTFVDRSAAGQWRPNLIRPALTFFDPFVWTCAWGSLLVAGLSALIAMIIGTALAFATRTRTYWGRPIFSVMVLLPIIIPPAISAGVWRDSSLFGPLVIPDQGGLPIDITPWLIWLLAASVWGSSLTAFIVGARLAHIDPTATLIARSLGLGSFSRWSSLILPTILPSLLNAGGLIFTLVVFDPGPCLVLGLRRSLAVEALVELQSQVGLPRASAIGLIVAVISIVTTPSTYRGKQKPLPEPNRVGERFRSRLRPIVAIPLCLILLTWAVVSLGSVGFIGEQIVKSGLVLHELKSILTHPATLPIWLGSLSCGLAVLFLGTLFNRPALFKARPRGLVIPPFSVGIAFVIAATGLNELIRATASESSWVITAICWGLASAFAWFPLVARYRDNESIPFSLLILIASLAVTSSAPLIGFEPNSDLTTIGIQASIKSNDVDTFRLFGLVGITINLLAFLFAVSEKRSRIGDWLG